MIQRMLFLPYTFVLLNWAAMRGLLFYLRRGGLDQVWKDVHNRGLADGRQLHADLGDFQASKLQPGKP